MVSKPLLPEACEKETALIVSESGANQYESRAVQARGLVVEINTEFMEARLLRQVFPSFHDVCPSEGSVQVRLSLDGTWVHADSRTLADV